jgi:DNA-binding NtrC family response regulator
MGETSEAPEPSVDGGRVLIIDDEQRLAEILRLTLSGSHAVAIAHNGKRALELLLGPDDFDVVLCDVLLPDRSGPDIHREVSLVRPALARRFVFMTGGIFSDTTRELLASLPNPKIEKPFDLETVERIVQEQLAASRSAT